MNHAIEPRSVLTTIKRFLGDPAPAGRRNRSRAGVIVSILIVPLLLGVMACFVLPVPIGDPEKSRVDPAMSGIWFAADESEGWLVALEPYDKRTWLVTWMMLEAATDEDNEAEAGEAEATNDDDTLTRLVTLADDVAVPLPVIIGLRRFALDQLDNPEWLCFPERSVRRR